MKKTLYLFLLGLLIFPSCGEEEARYTVPRSPVNFIININNQDRELSGGAGTKRFTEKRISTDRLGFGGLIVVNSGNVSDQGLPILYAYDAACPNEDSRSSLVAPQSSGISAICQTCKSEYSILLGTGHVMSGPSKQSLQQYRVIPTDAHGGYRVVN